MNRFRSLLVLPLALLAALAVSACGDSGGDEDPQQVLDATFQNDQDVSSGSFELSFDVEAEGGSDPGKLEGSIGGPFQSGGEGKVPSFDVDGELSLESDAQDFSGSAGLTSTGSAAFVEFQGTDYEVPADAFQQFSDSYLQAQQQGQGDQQGLAALGIDPSKWLTDLSNEGTEDVDGTETIHISGQADVPTLVEDIKTAAENVPQAADQVAPAQLAQLDQLTDLVESAEFDVYSGADDEVLRKLEGEVKINPPDGEGSPDSVSFNFALSLTDVNDPQTISAPSGAQPLETLLQQFGVDPSQLGQLGAAAGGSGSAGGSASGGGSAASRAYLDCLAKAQGKDAIDQCAALLGQ